MQREIPDNPDQQFTRPRPGGEPLEVKASGREFGIPNSPTGKGFEVVEVENTVWELLSDVPAEKEVLSVDEHGQTQIDATIGAIRDGGSIAWEKVSGQVKLGIMVKVAEAGRDEMPVALFDKQDLSKHRDILGGKSLERMYQAAARRGSHYGKDAMTVLREETGLVPTAEDVGTAAKLERRIFWKRLPDKTNAEVIEMAADEIGVPPSLLTRDDYTLGHYDFLGGRSLSGVYKRYADDPERGDEDALDYISRKTGLIPTGNDVIAVVKLEGRTVDWNRVPPKALRDILERVAAVQKIPVSMVDTEDLRDHYEFLDGKTLGRLSQKDFSQIAGNEGDVTPILKRAGIEITGQDVLAVMRQDKKDRTRPIYWGKIPAQAVHDILAFVAEESGKEVEFVARRDLLRPIEDLNNKTFERLYGYALRVKSDDISAIEYIKKWARVDHITSIGEVKPYSESSTILQEDVAFLMANGISSSGAIARELGITLEEARKGLEFVRAQIDTVTQK